MTEPSLRQKELAKYMSDNVGISMSQAMKDLNYSESYSNSPHRLKRTKTWKKLMKECLPNSKLVRVVSEGLDANKVISARVIVNKSRPTSQADGELPVANSQTDDFIEVPDHAVRHKFVETALKMKGKLIDKTDVTSGGKPIPILGNVYTNNSDSQTDETE